MNVLTYPEIMSERMPVFLGGMTSKGDWQQRLQTTMRDTGCVFINTCRPDWDVTPPTQEEKNAHILWEFQWMNRAKNFFIYIPEDAKSPTVLLELGIALAEPQNRVIVCIEPGYSHYHNAVGACKAHSVKHYTTLDAAVKRFKDLFLNSTYFW